MTWIKLDDGCPDHPKIVGLSADGFRCWVQGLCYSSRYLTDGFVPTAALRQVGTPKAAAELAAAGLWVVVDKGWRIHDYTDHQSTKEEVLERRDKDRTRQQRHRGVTPMSHRDTTVGHGASHDGVRSPESESESETELGQNTSSSSMTDRVTNAELFDEFWTAYPRKVGKPAARKAWAKARRRENPHAIIAAAHRYRDDPNRDPEFTKHPGPWLNDDRWNDPPLPARTVNGKSAKTAGALAAFLDRQHTPALTQGDNP